MFDVATQGGARVTDADLIVAKEIGVHSPGFTRQLIAEIDQLRADLAAMTAARNGACNALLQCADIHVKPQSEHAEYCRIVIGLSAVGRKP